MSKASSGPQSFNFWAFVPFKTVYLTMPTIGKRSWHARSIFAPSCSLMDADLGITCGASFFPKIPQVSLRIGHKPPRFGNPELKHTIQQGKGALLCES